MTGKTYDRLAVSRCGHDKGNVYLIVREEEHRVWLCDGKTRKKKKPKVKNRKHIQPVCHMNREVSLLLRDIRQDSDVIHALRVYQKSIKEDSSCQNQM